MKREKIKNLLRSRKFIIGAIIVLCIPLIVTFARYASIILSDYYLESKHFYFNSDKLSAEYPTYQINNWTGLDRVDFDINLDSKKNELEFAPMDIDYELEYVCEADVICSLSKTQGIIRASNNSDSFSLTVTPLRSFKEGESTTVNVTARSKSPYEKEISARFIITSGKQGVGYEIVDSVNSPYLMLNITNALSYYTVITAFGSYSVGDQITSEVYSALSAEQKANCASAIINLRFDPEVILLDTTNKIMSEIIDQSSTNIGTQPYLNGISFKIDASSSTAIRFYKKDKRQNYTYPITNDISVINFSVS